MDEAAFGAIEQTLDWAENLYEPASFDNYEAMIEKGRAELVNARKCLDALEILVRCNTTDARSLDWLMAWRRADAAIQACRPPRTSPEEKHAS